MSDPFVAEIRMAGFNFAPLGWGTCDGSIMPISQNTALFSLLGTTYGGDGRVTFALPDLRGKVPIGAGQGPGLSPRFLGEQGGSDSVTLIATEMPGHAHGIGATAAPADRANPGSPASPNALGAPTDAVYSTAGPNAATHVSTLGAVGGNQPHNNLQPYLAVNFIIAMQGIFPPRS